VRAAHLAFRSWRRSRPFWAGVWAILGGAIIAYVPATAFKLFLIASSSLVMGVLVGALVGFFGLMLWFARPLRVLLGVLILLLSLVSFITSDFGGLILGMLMGLVGGSLALSWVPTKVTWGERRRVRKLIKAGGAQTEAVEQAAETVALPEPDSAEEATTPDLADALLEGDVIDPEQPAPRRFRSRRIGRHGAPTRHS
jgi:hypothetical protein